MPLKWGVDSSHIHADRVVRARNGRPVRPPRYATVADSVEGRLPRGQTTLYDYVTNRLREPQFWGRYINPGDTNRRRATRLRPEEVTYIFGRSEGRCKILLVYNGISRQGCETAGREGYRRGWNDAWNACGIARNMGVPAGVRIYGNIEGRWRVMAEWIQGWWAFMHRSEFAGMGGLYGKGAELGRNWREQRRRAVEKDFFSHARMYRHRYLSSSVAWADTLQFSDRSLRCSLKASPGQRHIWTNTPRRAGVNRETHIPDTFLGVGPFRGAITVVWQYSLECWGGRLIDMNVARGVGYQDMWSRDNA